MANLKLNQIIALQKGAKAAGEGALTKAYHDLQKSTLLTGLTKTYKSRDDEGESLPSEGVKLQLRTSEVLSDLKAPLKRLLDLTATLDAGNQQARADVVVDDVVVLPGVPVTTLLTLEKKLVDLTTFVSKLPVLDASENWHADSTSGAYKTEPDVKTRSKKVPRNHLKAAATDKHPAQVEMYYEDVVVGDWTTTKFSGAIPEEMRRDLLAKVTKLAAAIKVAREAANMTEVADVKIGDSIFTYLGW